MPLSGKMILIVMAGVFLAGLIDGIAGGGGIISVPTYFLAGLPVHLALGTNKLSSSIGTAVSAGRFVKGGYVDWRLGIPAIVLALIGAHFGTILQLKLNEIYLKWLLIVILPIVAAVVLQQHSLPEERESIPEKKRRLIILLAALIVGAYDGFYGPGAGTFLLLIFCKLGKLDLRTAAGNVKLVNLASNVGALVTSLINGKVFIALGLTAAVASIAGHYFGSGMAIKDGSRIVRPVIVVVLVLLTVKVLTELV